jgi:uncharacterized protein (TIGR02266 family)
MQGRVLVVGLERERYDELLPLLSRSQLAVDRLARGEHGVQVAQKVAFDLIVVRHPLPDMSVGSFMQSVHQPGSPCAATPVLFLTDDARLAELQALLPGGAKQAHSVSRPDDLVAAVAEKLKLAPRADVRVPVRLAVKLQNPPQRVDGESENLSERGMLLRTGEQLPLGTRLVFELTLPGERLAVQGEAEVTRHAEPEVEALSGMGLKVLGFKGDGASRVRRFVERQAARSR